MKKSTPSLISRKTGPTTKVAAAPKVRNLSRGTKTLRSTKVASRGRIRTLFRRLSARGGFGSILKSVPEQGKIQP